MVFRYALRSAHSGLWTGPNLPLRNGLVQSLHLATLQTGLGYCAVHLSCLSVPFNERLCRRPESPFAKVLPLFKRISGAYFTRYRRLGRDEVPNGLNSPLKRDNLFAKRRFIDHYIDS